MKKICSIFVLCLLLALSACGEKAVEPTAAPTPTQELIEETTTPSDELAATATPSEAPSTEPDPAFSSEYYQNGAFVLPEAEIAQQSESCDGFGALAWGETSERLFEENIANFAVQYGAEYAGFRGTAYYTFRDNALMHVELAYYALSDKSDVDVFIEARSALMALYGEPTPAANGSTLEEVMHSGSGLCAEIWHAEAETGEQVKIELRFDAAREPGTGESATTLTFWYSGV